MTTCPFCLKQMAAQSAKELASRKTKMAAASNRVKPCPVCGGTEWATTDKAAYKTTNKATDEMVTDKATDKLGSDPSYPLSFAMLRIPPSIWFFVSTLLCFGVTLAVGFHN